MLSYTPCASEETPLLYQVSMFPVLQKAPMPFLSLLFPSHYPDGVMTWSYPGVSTGIECLGDIVVLFLEFCVISIVISTDIAYF